MLCRTSLVSFRDSIRRIARSLIISLLAFVIGANGWIVTSIAAAHEELPSGDEVSMPVDGRVEESDKASSSAASRECTSVAAVRWLPHGTLNIGYARGDFTNGERAAFHKAVKSWQQALAQTDIGIVLDETGEIDIGAAPAHSQIIVKRAESMDEEHYGKIVAIARRDNYLERASILIKGSLHKRDGLQKAMLHELGHVFGLRDCPECRADVTVMNYFSHVVIMGLKVRGGTNKIAKQPTAGDISQVLSGYRQSQPPSLANVADESEDTRTIVSDDASDRRNSADSDNIIAPYLELSSKRANAQVAVAPYLNLLSQPEEPGSTGVPFIKMAWKQDISRFSLLGPVSEREASPLGIFLFPKPARNKVANGLAAAPFLRTVSERREPSAIASDLKATAEKPPSALVVPPTPESEVARTAKIAIDSRARESVLTNAERMEFESYLPTLLETEAQTMKELNNYSFRREVQIQTLDRKGQVSGEYHRISDLLFDDAGNRIERGLLSSEPRLSRLEISPQYVEDFSGAQLKGFELSKRDHYRIEPFMTDTTDGARMRVYRMTPLNLNAERAAHTRVFYGFVWVDEKTGKIVKLRGCALPDDKQRYPLFETQRALIDGVHLFPVRTIADDYLVFPSHRVHIRMLITYTNYKKFASRVSITEVEGR
jgi:hypothetical protein